MGALSSTTAGLAMLGVLLLAVRVQAEPSDDLDAPRTNAGGMIVSSDSDDVHIDLVDPALDRRLEVVNIDATRGGNNLLAITATLRNKTGARLSIAVETIYRDKQGSDLNAGTWLHLTLGPHEVHKYRSSAIAEAAVDFLIRVRPAPGGR
jgi:hypothetical protein